MLEKPELKDEEIINCLRYEFGLSVEKLSFLPLGADFDTAVYHALANDRTAYFVKLRKGDFNKASVMVPKFLGTLGIKQIIPPLTTQTGQLWASLNPFKVMLYPFVEGHNGFEKKLSNEQWVIFGEALKRFHTANLPLTITSNINKETFSPRWRNTVKMFLARIEKETLMNLSRLNWPLS